MRSPYMKAALTVALGSAAVLIASCASSELHAATPPIHPSPKPAHDPAGNKAEANALAKRLVAIMALPQGAKPFTGTPPTDLGPVSMPGSSQVATASAYWQVPVATSTVQQWGRDHPPSGFILEGTGYDGTEGYSVELSGPVDPNAPQNQPAEIQLAATANPADPQTSIWFVGSDVVWYDSTPVRVPPASQTLRLTAAGGCPHSLGDATDVANTFDGRGDELIPPGTPTAGLLCAFPDSTFARGPIPRSGSLPPPEAAALATQLRRLKVGSYGSGPHSCPIDVNANVIVVLALPSGDVDLWWHDSGCPSVDNGTILAEDGDLTLTS